jgi:transcriptional regulator with XRE-family HTH domain
MAGELAVQVGRLLKDLRGETSRTEAAARLGVARPVLIRLEEGQDNPTLERIERVATAYGVELCVTAVNPDPS